MNRVGGISALALASAYVLTIGLFALAGGPAVGGGEAWLKHLEGKTAVWWSILALSILTDLLYIPVAGSLYLALKRVNRKAMLLAIAFVGLFIVLDLAVTWTNYTVLISLKSDYAGAATDAQRATLVAAADYASSVLSSRLEVVYAIGTLSFAILIVGLVMLRGQVFGKAPAYLAVLTGILGIAAIAVAGLLVILNAILATIWLFFVGYGLIKLEAVQIGSGADE